MMYEVKRTRAVWDNSLSVPGTERRGGWRCPPGTRYGGQITDRFGRNCGWGVVRRLGMGIGKLGENIENIADRRREGRVARRNERVVRRLAEEGTEVASEAVRSITEKIRDDKKPRRKRGESRKASEIAKDVDSIRDSLKSDKVSKMSDADLDKSEGELTLLENEIRDLVAMMNDEGDARGAESLSEKLDDIKEESKKITKEKRKRMRGGSRRKRSPRVVEERDAAEDGRIDTISKTPVPAGDPQKGESLNAYKRRKYNEHQARVRKLKEQGNDVGFLKYSEWDRFHGPVVEENWRKFNPDAPMGERDKTPRRKSRRATRQVTKDKTKPQSPIRIENAPFDRDADEQDLRDALKKLKNRRFQHLLSDAVGTKKHEAQIKKIDDRIAEIEAELDRRDRERSAIRPPKKRTPGSRTRSENERQRRELRELIDTPPEAVWRSDQDGTDDESNDTEQKKKEQRRLEIGEQIAMGIFPDRPNETDIWDVEILMEDMRENGLIDVFTFPLNSDGRTIRDINKLPDDKRERLGKQARAIAVQLAWKRIELRERQRLLGRDFLDSNDPFLELLPEEIKEFEEELNREIKRWSDLANDLQLPGAPKVTELPLSPSQPSEILNTRDIPATMSISRLAPAGLRTQSGNLKRAFLTPIDSVAVDNRRKDLFDAGDDWYRDNAWYGQSPADLVDDIINGSGDLINPHMAGESIRYEDVEDLRLRLMKIRDGEGEFADIGPRRYIKLKNGSSETIIDVDDMIGQIDDIENLEEDWRRLIYHHAQIQRRLGQGNFKPGPVDSIARNFPDKENNHLEKAFPRDAFPNINSGESADVVALDLDFNDRNIEPSARTRFLHDVVNNLIAADMFGRESALIGDDELVGVMHVDADGVARILVGRRRFMNGAAVQRAFGDDALDENNRNIHFVGKLRTPGRTGQSFVPGPPQEVFKSPSDKEKRPFIKRLRSKLISFRQRDRELKDVADIIERALRDNDNVPIPQDVIDRADGILDDNMQEMMRDALRVAIYRKRLIENNERISDEALDAIVQDKIDNLYAFAARRAKEIMDDMRLRKAPWYRGSAAGLDYKAKAIKGLRGVLLELGGGESWRGLKPEQVDGVLSALDKTNIDMDAVNPDDWRIRARFGHELNALDVLRDIEIARLLKEMDALPENQSSLQFIDDQGAKRAADAAGRLRNALKKGEKKGWRDINKILVKYFPEYRKANADAEPLKKKIDVKSPEQLREMSIDELLEIRNNLKQINLEDDKAVLDALEVIRKAKTNSKEDRQKRRDALKVLANLQKQHSDLEKYKTEVLRALVREQSVNAENKKIRLDVAVKIKNPGTLLNQRKVNIESLVGDLRGQGIVRDEDFNPVSADEETAIIQELLNDVDSVRGFRKDEVLEDLKRERNRALKKAADRLEQIEGDLIDLPESVVAEQRRGGLRGVRRADPADVRNDIQNAIEAQKKIDLVDRAAEEYDKLPKARARSLNRPSVLSKNIKDKVDRELRPFGENRNRGVIGKPLEFDGDFPLPRLKTDFAPEIQNEQDALRFVDEGGSLDKVPHQYWGHVLFNSKLFTKIVDPNRGAIGETHIFILKSDPTKGYVLKAQGSNEQAGEVIGWNLIAAHGFPVDGAVIDGKMPNSGKNGVIIPFAFQDAPKGAVIRKRGKTRNFNIVDIRDRFKDRAVVPRIANLMHNWLLGVGDRHGNNGMAQILRVDGVDYPYVVPIDQGRAAWSPYGLSDYGRNFHMDPLDAIKMDIRSVLDGNKLNQEEKEELKQRVRQIVDQFIERSNRIADLSDDVIRTHFAGLDPKAVQARAHSGNGTRIDEIISNYRTQARWLKANREKVLKDLGVDR